MPVATTVGFKPVEKRRMKFKISPDSEQGRYYGAERDEFVTVRGNKDKWCTLH